MKKTYIQPTITIVKTDTENALMAGSITTATLEMSEEGTVDGSNTAYEARRSPDFWDEEE